PTGAVRPVEQKRVVDRPAVELVRADREPEAVRAGDLADPVGFRARNLERRAGELGPRRLRVLPAGEEAHPAVGRVDGNERLREEDELRAFPGRLSGDLGDPVDRG